MVNESSMASAGLVPIRQIAEKIGIPSEAMDLYGDYKAKIKLSYFNQLPPNAKNKLILVSAMTPTPAGEGKTTVAISLAMGLNRIGKSAIVTLREPSLGPLFGMKGGATGAGKAKVLPVEEINIHFTGDIHAVTAAHNLIAACLDNHIFRRKEPIIDPRRVTLPRVMDMNDRALRNIIVGLGGKSNGIPRETGFIITAASEIMAILCLVKSYSEMQEKLNRIILGYTYDSEPVCLGDLKITGAVASLLKEPLKPNLVQTSEGTPAFVHGGPFANIAQGTCSIMSMKMAAGLADFVVTEAGFGFDLGGEKFFDIVCRMNGLNPQAVVLVATVRALKMHGGKSKSELDIPDLEAIRKGFENLEKHLENLAFFGIPGIVALNRFATDTEAEISLLNELVASKGYPFAVVDSFAKGSAGAIELAEKVAEIVQNEWHYTPLYELDTPVIEKINTVCQKIYGAEEVEYTPEARADLQQIKNLGLENLPICIAKTQNSLSDNPNLIGRPRNYTLTVRQIGISAGAGFLVPVTGNILLMPGLPTKPVAENVTIDDDGNISGLF
ncbi:MAG TPA: formate--tetrahydrofolate ligase [Candidatus Marinimicrobia bacterium]|jgi:formate--tetrahydrofolate ligase|nr:formate--tetrahydrofolate ligase [Candidatus Neomarinimicrobiota bacterium]